MKVIRSTLTIMLMTLFVSAAIQACPTSYYLQTVAHSGTNSCTATTCSTCKQGSCTVTEEDDQGEMESSYEQEE